MAMFRITDSSTKNTKVSFTISHPVTAKEALWYTLEFVSTIPPVI